jgi:hypothetical protein
MNIAIGKPGKSILFNPSKWGPIGGDNEAPIYFENLFRKNPNDTFYILGRSDYSRLPDEERNRINEHGNVIDLWADFSIKIETAVVYIDRTCASIKFDVGVMIAGPLGTNTVQGKSCLMKDPTKLASPIMMLANYAGPVLSVLNDHKFPYVLVVNDPRFFPTQSRDMMHLPAKVLSQYNETIIQKTRTTYGNPTILEYPLTGEYVGVETIRLIDLPKPASRLSKFMSSDEPKPKPKKDINFLVVLNEGLPSRYNLLKKSILDHVDDVDIYGKWNPDTIGDDSRFKGSVKYAELQAMLDRVKYSYCIPIKKGWVTSKFWEMIQHDIIPFLHETYDDQNNLNVPPFLRIKDSADLKRKIDILEDDPNKYIQLLTHLRCMITPEYVSGDHLNRITMSAIDEILA